MVIEIVWSEIDLAEEVNLIAYQVNEVSVLWLSVFCKKSLKFGKIWISAEEGGW